MSIIERLSEEKERAPCLSSGDTERYARNVHTGIKMWGTQRCIALDVLMVCWGLGTWLGVNGLYVQLPLLVLRLPEGWKLPSSMVLAIQLANAGLLLYALLRRLRPSTPDAVYIYVLLAVGSLALALNAFLYEHTAVFGGTERSVTFLALTFFAALVGCTSSVLFYPYLRHFRDIYLVTYLIGEGLSGFIPSILSLIQGVGGEPECVIGEDGVHVQYPEPRFGTSVFLLILAALSAFSFLSFLMVDRFSGFEKERVAPAAAAKDEEATTEPVALLSTHWLSVMTLMGVLNALSNGILPSVQSYSCMPYGTLTYHLAVTLSAMANPAACLAGVWLRPVPARALAALLLVAALPLAYILATALLSPMPPLQNSGGGIALVVSSWVCVSGCVSYARMWVYAWARRGGARGMRATGASTQLGSALGSALMFVLVSYTAIFTQAPSCPEQL